MTHRANKANVNPKNWILVALATSALLSGAIDQYFYPNVEMPPTAGAYMLINMLLIFFWYRLDSDAIGYRRSAWLNIAVVALALIALPWYFFRSRGARRGAITTGLMLLALIAGGVLTAAGYLLVYYVVQS